MKQKKPVTYRPRYLGRPGAGPTAQVDLIPWSGGAVRVALVCREFTALCPVTGQPDFGELTVTYVPQRSLIETKSLKLYLWRYRDRGVFNEALVAEVAADLFRQAAPEWIEVHGRFASRGGIEVSVQARWPQA